MRDNFTKQIKREIIEVLGKQIYPENKLLTEELKLKLDFQQFLQKKIDLKETEYTTTTLTKEYQGLYKRIKRQGKYKKRGVTDRERVHQDLGESLAKKVKIKHQEHRIYTEEYMQEIFSNFIKELKEKGETSRGPKRLEYFDRDLYVHIIRRDNGKKDRSFWEKVNKKYGDKSINLEYQTYSDLYILESMGVLYKQLKDNGRKFCHPQDIHLFDLGIFRCFGQKKFRGANGRVDWSKVATDYWPHTDIPLTRNDRIFSEDMEIALFKDFFKSNKSKYRSPNKLKKFDAGFYGRLSRTYKYNNSIDRFYILIHIVKDSEKILLFRHRHKQEFNKRNLNRVIRQQHIELEKIEYRLPDGDLDPEELMIYQEERDLLQIAILKLSQEERDIIEQFYNEQKIDIQKLNNIIEKLKSMI